MRSADGPFKAAFQNIPNPGAIPYASIRSGRQGAGHSIDRRVIEQFNASTAQNTVGRSPQATHHDVGRVLCRSAAGPSDRSRERNERSRARQQIQESLIDRIHVQKIKASSAGHGIRQANRVFSSLPLIEHQRTYKNRLPARGQQRAAML